MFGIVFRQFKSEVNQSWLQWLFSWTALAQLFNRDVQPLASEFLASYHASWSWTRYMFRACLSQASLAELDLMMHVSKELTEANINISVINAYFESRHHHRMPSEFTRALILLAKIYALFDRELMLDDLSLLEHHDDPLSVVKIIEQKPQQHVYVRALFHHPNPSSLAAAIWEIKQVNKFQALLHDMLIQLLVRHPSPQILLLAVHYLYEKNNKQLPLDLLLHISGHKYPLTLAQAIYLLTEEGILDELNMRLISRAAKPLFVATFLVFIHQQSFLNHATQKILEERFVGIDFSQLVKAVYGLRDMGKLNQDNFQGMLKHSPQYLFRVLTTLYSSKNKSLLQYEPLICRHRMPRDFMNALLVLSEHQLLQDANVSCLFEQTNPDMIAFALFRINKVLPLNNVHLRFIESLLNPEHFCNMLFELDKAHINNIRNLDILMTRRTELNIHYNQAFNLLRQARLLTQDNFDKIMDPENSELVYQTFWLNIPVPGFTQVDFDDLINSWQREGADRTFIRIMNQIRIRMNMHRFVFNPSQSTHSLSVHRSVSESALRLKQSYPNLDTTAICVQLTAYMTSLEDNPVNAAAKRLMDSLVANQIAGMDLFSEINLRELLALVYHAMHDETKRKDVSGLPVSLSDVQVSFVKHAYEIQRGYNLDSKGVDNQLSSDGRVCFGGIFNQLIYSLNGLHTDVCVLVITREHAATKFRVLVQEYALAYLKANDHSDVLMQLQKADHCGPIWPYIHAQVEEALWQEFAEAYAFKREDPNFRMLFSYVHDIPLPDLSSCAVKMTIS